LPCVAGGVYLFGWRVLVVVIVACVTGFVSEYIFCRRRKEPVTEAVFVTGTLYALILPPTVPWHVVVIGMVFAIVMVKEVFGGFGRNFFNPAMAGRCFVYICFPLAMTAEWAQPAPSIFDALQRWIEAGFTGGIDLQHWYGALLRWSTATPDTITTATPMGLIKVNIFAGKEPNVPSLVQLLLGNISGVMGATSALLILVGGAYLYWTKTASRTIILSVVITYMVLNQTLAWLGVKPFVGALPVTLGAGFLFGAFFMATDPVSAPKGEVAKVLYGILIAVSTLVIRNFSIFPAGFMFALLIGNMFAPILDYAVNAWKERGMRRARGGGR
ncbi:MAG: RnfABCDGE type electron transport complex subunit D, partial [bacterium]|nr:RnfABCDGE type electron transport complex subunit D [bacterium]